MKCVFCGKNVFGEKGTTVLNKGPAHIDCFEAMKALKRTFMHLEISELSDEQLKELKELVLAEENSRDRGTESDIELF